MDECSKDDAGSIFFRKHTSNSFIDTKSNSNKNPLIETSFEELYCLPFTCNPREQESEKCDEKCTNLDMSFTKPKERKIKGLGVEKLSINKLQSESQPILRKKVKNKTMLDLEYLCKNVTFLKKNRQLVLQCKPCVIVLEDIMKESLTQQITLPKNYVTLKSYANKMIEQYLKQGPEEHDQNFSILDKSHQESEDEDIPLESTDEAQIVKNQCADKNLNNLPNENKHLTEEFAIPQPPKKAFGAKKDDEWEAIVDKELTKMIKKYMPDVPNNGGKQHTLKIVDSVPENCSFEVQENNDTAPKLDRLEKSIKSKNYPKFNMQKNLLVKEKILMETPVLLSMLKSPQDVPPYSTEKKRKNNSSEITKTPLLSSLLNSKSILKQAFEEEFVKEIHDEQIKAVQTCKKSTLSSKNDEALQDNVNNKRKFHEECDLDPESDLANLLKKATHNSTGIAVTKENVTVVFENLYLNDYEIYYPNQPGQIGSYIDRTSLEFTIIKNNRDTDITYYKNCCWCKRHLNAEIIKNIQIIKRTHLCSINDCVCCCKKNVNILNKPHIIQEQTSTREIQDQLSGAYFNQKIKLLCEFEAFCSDKTDDRDVGTQIRK